MIRHCVISYLPLPSASVTKYIPLLLGNFKSSILWLLWACAVTLRHARRTGRNRRKQGPQVSMSSSKVLSQQSDFPNFLKSSISSQYYYRMGTKEGLLGQQRLKCVAAFLSEWHRLGIFPWAGQNQRSVCLTLEGSREDCGNSICSPSAVSHPSVGSSELNESQGSLDIRGHERTKPRGKWALGKRGPKAVFNIHAKIRNYIHEMRPEIILPFKTFRK